MFKITYLSLAVSIIISFLFLFMSPYLKTLNIRIIAPVMIYPGNIIAYTRVLILLFAIIIATSVPVGKRNLFCASTSEKNNFGRTNRFEKVPQGQSMHIMYVN